MCGRPWQGLGLSLGARLACSEGSHLRKHRAHVWRGRLPLQMAVDAGNGGDDPFAVAPFCVACSLQLRLEGARRFLTRHACVKGSRRALLHERKIVAYGSNAALVADRPVPGYDVVELETEQVIARSDPVLDRSRPHDRVAADEQQIARIYNPIVGRIDRDVAAGMRGAELYQLELLGAEFSKRRPLKLRSGTLGGTPSKSKAPKQCTR